MSENKEDIVARAEAAVALAVELCGTDQGFAASLHVASLHVVAAGAISVVVGSAMACAVADLSRDEVRELLLQPVTKDVFAGYLALVQKTGRNDKLTSRLVVRCCVYLDRATAWASFLQLGGNAV